MSITPVGQQPNPTPQSICCFTKQGSKGTRRNHTVDKCTYISKEMPGGRKKRRRKSRRKSRKTKRKSRKGKKKRKTRRKKRSRRRRR